MLKLHLLWPRIVILWSVVEQLSLPISQNEENELKAAVF